VLADEKPVTGDEKTKVQVFYPSSIPTSQIRRASRDQVFGANSIHQMARLSRKGMHKDKSYVPAKDAYIRHLSMILMSRQQMKGEFAASLRRARLGSI
jgi:hypothetical protein